MQITISREQHLKARNVFFARVANVADVRIKCEARSPMAQFWPDLVHPLVSRRSSLRRVKPDLPWCAANGLRLLK